MAASTAPHSTTTTAATTTNVTSTTATTTTLFPLTNTTCFTNDTTTITTTSNLNTAFVASNSNTANNIHDLCRSCGKTNDELYDLFQQQTTNLVTATTNHNNNDSSISPFNTSSTTCYAHLPSKLAKLATMPMGCEKSSLATTTTTTGTIAFDSVAATAKATAKGQSNMDNILQEMQIWQLMIKFNDGLPQRICAKCTAQFYMIHKFRRKCLKVQMQLRTLYWEQQQHKMPEQSQQQSDENQCENKAETTIEPPTSTPQVDIVISQSQQQLLSSADIDTNAYNIVKQEQDEQEQQQPQQNLMLKEQQAVDNESMSVAFERQTVDTTLLDNVVTVEAVPSSDEKKPPLPLESGSASLLTSSQHVCDKTNNNNETGTVSKNALNIISVVSEESKERNECKEMITQQIKELPNFKDSPQSTVTAESLFITKAALKAYSNTNTTKCNQNMPNTVSIGNNEQTDNVCSSTCIRNTQSCNTSNNINSTLAATSVAGRSRRRVKNRRRRRRKHSKAQTNAFQLSLKQNSLVFRRKLNSNKRHLTVDVKTYSSSSSFSSSPPTAAANKTAMLRRSRTAAIRHKTLVRKQKTHHRQQRLQKQTDSVLMADESSSSSSSSKTSKILSTSSSASTMASSSSSSSSAVTCSETKNFACNQTGSPKKTTMVCSVWKTKAAMKANANDLPHTELNLQQQQTPFNSLNSCLSSSSPSSSSLGLANDNDKEMAEENKSLKTPQESHTTNNNNKHTSCTITTTGTNSSQHLSEDEFKDREQTNKKQQHQQQKLLPVVERQGEEVEQKQKEIEMSKTIQESLENDQKTIEIPCANDENNTGEKQPKPVVVKTPPTPPPASANMGCMKLILQRKRGTRFTCRPKTISDDNYDDEAAQPLQPTTSKRRRKSTSSSSTSTSRSRLPTKNNNHKIFSLSSPSLNNKENDNNLRNFEEINLSKGILTTNASDSPPPPPPTEEDANKENPALHEYQQELDADSDLSSYRDPLLIPNNDINEEDTHLADFPQSQLVAASLPTECSKEMFRRIYKEKTDFDSSKKLIVRVPLTSLTQDFKRLHLTMESQGEEVLVAEEEGENQQYITTFIPQSHGEEQSALSIYSPQNSSENNENCSAQSNTSDLLGFTPTDNSPMSSSSLHSICKQQTTAQMVDYIQPPLCSASSKINDFINDFQNNCIDSSEIEDSNEATLPHLTPRIAQELSDEIRDVEDTLNGILSEMHDKDMYTPRSGTTDDFFTHSVYSPLTDSHNTTPAHSFYAESPCTINSNPMSVSPFVHQNMDYNAMTPQSNHSSIGPNSQITGYNGIFRDQYPSYKECFEESTQSELIGFQNNIPCFENIGLEHTENSDKLLAQTVDINGVEAASGNTEVQEQEQQQETEQKVEPGHEPEIVDFIDLSNYQESNEESANEVPISTNEGIAPHIAYNPLAYQQASQIQHANNSLLSNTTTTNAQPHYIVTNTSQGPILITNPRLSQGQEQIGAAFKPHSNNLQFITLGQAMENNRRQMPANHLTTTELNWPTTVNAANNYQQQQQPVLTTANTGTTTYFINTNGELYQANIPSTAMQNTILLPSNATQNSGHSIAFNRPTNNDHSDGYISTTPVHQANTAATASPSSQYIMVVNSVTGAPQYFATNTAPLNQQGSMAAATNITTPSAAAPPAVVYQPPQITNATNLNSSNYVGTSPNPASNGLSTNTAESPSNFENKPATHVPITPAIAPSTARDNHTNQTMHQRVNLQLQRQIKERQQLLLHPRSPKSAQKITLVCRFCHKRPKFTNNVDYSNHIINMHPAEKPYNCPHCPIYFSRRFERQQHVAQVHGSRYQCAQCGLSFCAQRALDFHLQKHHANLGATQLRQQNSTPTAIAPAVTYKLLPQNQQQRLVRVEDVHVQMSDENKNKRSIDLPLDTADIKTSPSMQELDLLSVSSGSTTISPAQQSRKLCCPDCNGDNDNCCGSDSNQNHHLNSQQLQQEFIGNESVNNHHHHHANHHQQQHQQQQQPQHVTIPSPEQTEPDSTTTLRHFRKRQLSEKSLPPTPILSSSTTTTTTATSTNTNTSSSSNENNHDNLTVDGGVEQQQQQQNIVIERTLRGTHNCLLCEESFTNEIALRKHHHLAHGTQTIATSSSSSSFVAATATTSSLVCTICKRGFRMRNALQRHMETHDSEGRPYECNICQVRFPRPSQLTLHKLTVHKFEKPNACDECGKQFGTESAMKAHIKTHEAAKVAKTTTITETAAANAVAVASSASSSSASQLSARIYLDAMTTIATSTLNPIEKTTTNAAETAAAIITTTINEQNINLQSLTSGERSTTTATNNNSVAIDAHDHNNATPNAIVASGLTR